MSCDCCDNAGRWPSNAADDFSPEWIRRMNALMLRGDCAMDDEIIKQIWGGIATRKITICWSCDTILSYTRNTKYCDECRISHRRVSYKRWKNKSEAKRRNKRAVMNI
jgi:DNA primase large subunit